MPPKEFNFLEREMSHISNETLERERERSA
jgi:hypothetical protein